MKTLFYLSIILFFISCKKNESDSLLNLKGKTFIMECDRVTNNSLAADFPSEDLQESNYEQISSRSIGEVRFTNNNQNITIEPSNFTTNEQITGIAEEINETNIKYFLESGLFAGGRFIVWKENDQLEFEFTIFGSGVSIIGSSRGTLVTSGNL